jgi:hypothetical protein
MINDLSLIIQHFIFPSLQYTNLKLFINSMQAG